MESEAGDTQILEPLCLVKRMQDAQHPFLVVRPDSRAGACLEQIAQALMAEALDHGINCSASHYTGKPSRDTLDYAYDPKGNRTQSYTHDASGTLVRSIDLTFDPRNRIKTMH